MAISFHCTYCGKKIEAADESAGKWGKCPACHNKLYIPDLSTDEEIKLAPVNKDEEEREKQLLAETFRLEQDILSEREIPEESASTAPSETSKKELTKNIIVYLRYMADGNVDEAKKTLTFIIPFSSQAVKILDSIALSEIPEPELADIPQQVLSGLIKNLRSHIN